MTYHATPPDPFASVQVCSAQEQHRSIGIEMSSGKISEIKSFTEHLDDEVARFVSLYPNTTALGADLGADEKTARNLRDIGIPQNVKRYFAWVRKHPELASRIFGEGVST